MDIKFSIRGNGACPVCKKSGKCSIQDKMKKAIEDIRDKQAYGMEAVIYNCPAFEEAF